MQGNDMNDIIAKALIVDKEVLRENVQNLLKKLKVAFEDNRGMMLKANQIDVKNNNGFQIDHAIINNIFNNIEKENIVYGDVTNVQRDTNNKIIYGTQIMDRGNVIVINDGNSYVIIEMLLRNILAGNTVIFANNGYMFGTNQFILQIAQSVLEQFNISKYLIQMYIDDNYEKILSNYANIDLVICIGDHSFQNAIIPKSKNVIITSGYENFDLYIEDKTHLSFINDIINTGLNVQIYINDALELDYPNSLHVNDIDEAITQINYNGSRYSAAIFTSSSENASKFINGVKSSIVTANASPTIERVIDIKQSDLVIEKKIIYPFDPEFDGNSKNIKLSEEEEY